MDRKALTMLCAALLPMFSCHMVRQEKSAVQEPAVRVLPVAESSQTVSSSRYIGSLRPTRMVTVTSSNPGTLKSFNLRVGDRLTEGQVICELESSAVKSAYEMASATLKQAEDGYERLSKAYGSGSVPEIKMVEMETNLAKARASYEAASQALEQCSIKAPFTGVVEEVYINGGNEVSFASPIVKMVDTESLEISIPVPENEISHLRPGETASVEVPALGREFKARLLSKGVLASPLSHSYECLFVPVSHVPGLMPGMACRLTLDSSITEAMVIPSTAVLTDKGGRYVWTVNRDNIVEKTYVEISGYSGKGVVVAGGLPEGLRVIVEGSRKVSGGMKVKILEENEN